MIAWVLLFLGCHEGRVDDLDVRVAALQKEVAALQAEATMLADQLEKQPAPTAAERVDNAPEGFNADKPLPKRHPTKPDVLLLSIDTLRADHLGTYGYERPTSPVIDALGAGGMVFEQAWAPSSWTLPSHTTMLSGWLPVHHGTIEDHLAISPDVPLVQEAFRASGYGTAAVVSTLFVSSRFGFDRGFDHFEDFGIRTKQENNLSTVDADHVFDHATHWAQGQPDEQPLFMFLHVYDVHYRYDPPAPWNEKFDRTPAWGDEVYKKYHVYLRRMIDDDQLAHQIAQYDEEIAFVDATLGDFLARWKAAGRDVVVAVTADHGEEFGERGSWGHAHTLWPEQLHVPLVVSGPGVPTGRSDVRVGTEDVAATLASLAGVPFRGRDGLARIGASSDARPPNHVAAQFADTSRFDTLQYRWHAWPYDLYFDVAEGRKALCKLDTDPTCKVDLSGDEPEVVERLSAEMWAYLGDPWTATEEGKIEVHDGLLFTGGQRKNLAMSVQPGARFAVEPGDALVRFRSDAGTVGPWRPLGGALPGAGCPVTFEGRTIQSEIGELSDEESAMLEALGYVQDDEGEAAPLGPIGPTDCVAAP